MDAHSGQNYFINVMLCLSNFEVFAVIFTRACNYIILLIISFMLCVFIFMVPLINCMTYMFPYCYIINFTLLYFLQGVYNLLFAKYFCVFVYIFGRFHDASH